MIYDPFVDGKRLLRKLVIDDLRFVIFTGSILVSLSFREGGIQRYVIRIPPVPSPSVSLRAGCGQRHLKMAQSPFPRRSIAARSGQGLGMTRGATRLLLWAL